MNTIPLVKGNTQEEINTSLIALKKALDEMNSSSSKTDASVQSQIKQINELITDINSHLDTIDGQITDLQPVDSVTSGNMQSVSSNAVAKMFFNPISNDFAISFSNQTANVTGFLYCTVWKRNSASVIVQEDNTELLRLDMHTSDSSLNPFTILIRKGHQYKIDNRGDTSAAIYSQKFVKLF